MVARPPLVVGANGRPQQLQSGDTLAAPGIGGSATVSTVTVDFGSPGRRSILVDVALATAAVGQKVLASPSLDMPAGVSEDELEMDGLTVAGRVLSAGNVRLICYATGPISGPRNINIILGS